MWHNPKRRNEMNYHILKRSVVFNFDGKTITIDHDHQQYNEIIDLLRDRDFEAIKLKIDIGEVISKFSNDIFTYYEGKVYSHGRYISGYIGDKILEFYHDALPFDNLIKFWNNLLLNPSEKSRENLYRFLETNSFPLTDDGCFIAYKRITCNYTDYFTNKISNAIGECVKIDIESVDPDPNIACSYGLHVAAYEYAQNNYHSGEGLLVEVKVNPRDVVAVPYDYNNQKCRVCEYTVLSVVDCKNNNPIVNVSDYKNNIENDLLTDDDYCSDNPEDFDDNLLTDDDYCSDNQEDFKDDQSSDTSYDIIKIGNYKYMLTNIPHEIMGTLQYHKRKKSRWPTAFKDDSSVIDIYRSDIGMGMFIYKVITNNSTVYVIPTQL
jgi:hypothetical protein